MINVTDLRKIFTQQGMKGASKWKRSDFDADIARAEIAAYEDQARMDLEAKHAAEVKAKLDAHAAQFKVEPERIAKNICPICVTRKKYTGNANGEKAPRLSEMCNPCFEEGGWENTHSDADHDSILATPEADRTEDQKLEIRDCWICNPELNLAQRPAKAGRSRAGMVIVAQGTEIHKSETFRKAAEELGWTVTIQTETYELGEDATGAGTRHYATATKGESHIALAWDGRAYDYAESGASFNGKARKVRNLKEALRLL